MDCGALFLRSTVKLTVQELFNLGVRITGYFEFELFKDNMVIGIVGKVPQKDPGMVR
jgi:hypothetical protein